MKKWITTIVAIGLACGIQAGTLITSDGAWSSTSINATSNGGMQTNYINGGAFGTTLGKDWYRSNADAETTNTMYMSAVSGNPDLTYQAGKTYIYQIQGYAAIESHSNTQNVMLIAGSDTNGIAGTLVSGLNNTGVYGINDQVAISGSYTVEVGDPIIGQPIGMKLFSSGIQTRWYSDGSSFISSVLADHISTGTLFSTEFELDGAGELITTANPIEMEVVVGNELIITNAVDSYFRMNITAEGAKNNFKLDAQADSFRASTLYTLSFRGQKAINGDAAQNEVDIILGGTYTNTLAISTTTTPYSMVINPDEIGLVGDDLSIEFVPAGAATAVNQYRVFNVDFSAEAPPPVHTGLLYQTSFETNAVGVIAVNNIDLEVVDGFDLIKEAADNYVSMNLNGSARNDFQLAAAADTFRELTTYTFSFAANKTISNDATQNELGLILGGVYTQTVVVSSSSKLPFSFDVNAEDLGFEGQPFSIEIEPLGTTSAVNQYRVYNLEITAVDIPADLTTNGTPHPWLDDYYPGLETDEEYEAQDISDTDGDGFRAWQEYQLGTDPTNALSLLTITEAAPAVGGEFVVTWQSAAGKSYNILTNVNLTVGNWGTAATAVPSAGAETSYTTTVGSAVNFFQVELD
ncbi:hypothetical protein PDESU_00018 [Pontiella desulfatans]|uniref:Uncharacterized protein n=1 Tax=Pontiella desulfatans TaxID=2750659 RepID=A0A6C2TVH0_PONDE|nr:thrombospondin type 3 repeat-containing protein [Pontiella desulfatans]VGO11474.1 hypothetical protein PDESU_00018 [Pontiella desulfatans]